ncbi:hypothetical protein OAF54_00090 [bacterium]|nr:hypothetical protein [bacterium]
MISKEQLEEWKALAEGASPGPWKKDGTCTSQNCWDIEGAPGDGADVDIRAWVGTINQPEDAQFIAVSRTAVPKLVEAVEKLTAGLWNVTREETREGMYIKTVDTLWEVWGED